MAGIKVTRQVNGVDYGPTDYEQTGRDSLPQTKDASNPGEGE